VLSADALPIVVEVITNYAFEFAAPAFFTGRALLQKGTKENHDGGAGCPLCRIVAAVLFFFLLS